MKQQQHSLPPFTLWLWHEELGDSETDRRAEMEQQQHSSPPFTLRLWQEELDGSEMNRRIEMEQQQYSSHLFTLRLWREELGGSETEWRCKVQHVTSGEVRYFRDWSTLITFLQQVLSGSEPNAHTD